jgi:hypothetical protein
MDQDDLLVLNGVDGSTGKYLVDPLPVEEVGKAALATSWDPNQFQELEKRQEDVSEKRYALRAGLDPQNLQEAGWGVVFPGRWSSELQQAVRSALWELLEQRKAQSGDLYREFLGADAPQAGESKNDFLLRHGAGPGLVDPSKVPYYLLLVGDPASITYQFQYELDVAYAVGRIYFDQLEDYARYARSVVTAQQGMADGSLRLSRRAAFWGPANPNDKATNLSAELLVKPLSTQMSTEFPDWEVSYINPDESHKARLLQLLGGSETPAFLFTASHGLGFPVGDQRQPHLQGALLCQDWPGPQETPVAVTEDAYVSAEDIGDQAQLLGLVSFHFACFGAGTPHWDSFAIPGLRKISALAQKPFLAALPQRLLAHPRGGALAVVGHIDRAWSFSFQWGSGDSQIVTYASLLHRLMRGDTVGSALDDLNLRYAEFATLLSTKIYEAEYTKPNLSEMARLWTAHNDARGYALLGDPAVRVVAAQPGEQATAPQAISAVSSPTGSLLEYLPVDAASGGSSQAADGEMGPAAGSFTAGLGQISPQTARPASLEQLVERLEDTLQQLSELSLVTCMLPGEQLAHLDLAKTPLPVGSIPLAVTAIKSGQLENVLAENLPADIQAAHNRFVQVVLGNLQEILKDTGDLLRELRPPASI